MDTKAKIENPLAFPQPMSALPTTGEMYCAVERHPDFGGMLLRDYFAAQALTGMLAYSHVNPATGNFIENCSEEGVAQMAYRYADAMLLARQKGAPQC